MAINKFKENEILTRIAWMYYYGKMRQQDIGDKLGVSRITIARSLKSAQDKGIVNVEISSEGISISNEDRSNSEPIGEIKEETQKESPMTW